MIITYMLWNLQEIHISGVDNMNYYNKEIYFDIDDKWLSYKTLNNLCYPRYFGITM